MMDETEHSSLRHIPMRSLSLQLARATIKMTHNSSWQIDKVNPVHDLIVCLSGKGRYDFAGDEEPVVLSPGDAMLIPAYTRFRGMHGGGSEVFTGFAQHFTLDLFGSGDLIQQLNMKRAIKLQPWEVYESLAQHFRDTTPHGATTLAQHHQFMVLLLVFLESAFLGWQVKQSKPDSQDHLTIQIMLVASRLSTDPLGGVLSEAMKNVPYNEDYFRRAFKERMGLTPQKFRELKRMEFAADRLGMGLTVKAVAAELGYNDPYFFSRIFKRYLGASPSKFREPRLGA